jgi:hypothetical protein
MVTSVCFGGCILLAKLSGSGCSRGVNEPNQREKSLKFDSTIDSLNLVHEQNKPYWKG